MGEEKQQGGRVLHPSPGHWEKKLTSDVPSTQTRQTHSSNTITLRKSKNNHIRNESFPVSEKDKKLFTKTDAKDEEGSPWSSCPSPHVKTKAKALNSEKAVLKKGVIPRSPRFQRPKKRRQWQSPNTLRRGTPEKQA